MYLEGAPEGVLPPLQPVNAWHPWGQTPEDPSVNQPRFVVWLA